MHFDVFLYLVILNWILSVQVDKKAHMGIYMCNVTRCRIWSDVYSTFHSVRRRRPPMIDSSWLHRLCAMCAKWINNRLTKVNLPLRTMMVLFTRVGRNMDLTLWCLVLKPDSIQGRNDQWTSVFIHWNGNLISKIRNCRSHAGRNFRSLPLILIFTLVRN